jgi:iron(III) transport system ATP-binding protein
LYTGHEGRERLNNAEGEALSAEITLSGVSKRFPGTERPAVEAVDLVIQPGEIVALLGPSGCGKTTTLRLVAGFESPDSGAISIAGTVVADEGRHLAPEKRGVGMVFQDYALFPHLDVEGNISFGLRGVPRGQRAARLEELLELTGLVEFKDRFPHQLSGGQQQRVAIARALAPRPHVLLLDEPFSNLDTEMRYQMRAEVRELIKASGTTAILVTHDQQEAMTVADRVAVMLDGVIAQVDEPETIYHFPATRAVANFVGQGTFVPARVAGALADSDLGQFTIEDSSKQDQVELLVRPRDVTLEVDPHGIATIVSRVFRGSETTYIVQLPCGVQLQSDQPSYVAIAPGARVRVRCNRARLGAYDAIDRIGMTGPMRPTKVALADASSFSDSQAAGS